jgi:hypothetical protein
LPRKIDPEALWIAIGHDSREFALLWLVFSILDRLVDERLTVRWLLANGLWSLVVWTLGAYLELRRPKERQH